MAEPTTHVPDRCSLVINDRVVMDSNPVPANDDDAEAQAKTMDLLRRVRAKLVELPD